MAPPGTLHVAVRDDAVRHLVAGTSVDLHGLPGSGRTALARAVADELEDAGWKVVRVHGVLPLRDRPLEALAVAGLVPRQGAPQGPTTAVSSAVQGVLSAVRDARTVLLVDDADDLDDASTGALAAAHARSPFPVLSTSRHTPPAMRGPGRLTALVQPGVTLEVGPLGFVDMQTLLVDALGGPLDQAAVSRVFAGSGGLAGLALALADGARHHGSLREVDGVWHAGPDLWSPELERAIDPLLHRLTAEAVDGVQALALAGTVDVTTARRFLSWDVLEELDGSGLLRFVARDDEMLVGAFPPAIVEHFRRLVGAWHLRVDEAVTHAFGASTAAGVATPYRLLGEADAGLTPWSDAAREAQDDVIVNRLLLEHWHRELLLRRDEWEQTPTPRTAAALLRTMLVTGADRDAVGTVRERTPRTGDRRELVSLDDWYAMFVGAVEHDVDRVRTVLDQARAEADEWAELVDAIETFVLLLVDHAPEPDDVPTDPPEHAHLDTREIVTTVRAEVLLARGRPAQAIAELERLDEPLSTFACARRSSMPWALVLEGHLDEALSRARDVLTTARREHDVENTVGAAYVAANVLLTRGRMVELRSLLGSVLSSGLLPALDRPQHVALLSIAAGIAADVGRVTTSRTLVQQALALQTGPGPYPLGSPTLAIARLDGVELPPAKAHALAAERLWAETGYLLERGYTVSGYVCGMLAAVEEPTAERAARLADVGAHIDAPLIRHYERLVHALADGDPDLLVGTADRLADDGMVWAATRAYEAGLSGLRANGAAARAAEVHDDARRRLGVWGHEAAAGLRSAAETSDLTAREHEIALLAGSGLTNQVIAQRLVISVRTVENHLNRAFRKLGVESRAELSRVLSG